MLVTSSWIIDSLLLLGLLFIVTYRYLTRNFNHWKKKNVQHPKPLPLFGNLYDVFTFKTTTQEYIKKVWDEIDAPYFGMFIFDEPVLVLKCPKLIKDVLIRDASTFCDRRVATPSHPHMEHGMFFLKSEEWRNIRKKFGPVFTLGMIKQLEHHLLEINKVMLDYVKKNYGVLDATKIGENFAIEFLIRCFYDVNPRCFERETSIFKTYIHKMFAFNLRNGIIQNFYFFRPSWISALKLHFIASPCIKFLEDVFKRMMKDRVNYDGKPRNLVDMANRAVREKIEGKQDTMEFEMIMSNAILFLIAGRDSTTIITSFTLYELALNEEIQRKLRREVKANVEKYGGLSFEGVQENKYLEMCIHETLRKYPTLPFMDRTCVNDYQFRDTDLILEKNTSVLIPLFALHRDPNIYPNSDVYNPERFSKDNNSDGLTFIPFGEGPRICIGKRLGMLALSMALSNLVLNFTFEKCSETPKKIEFETKSFALASKYELFLKITPIQESLNELLIRG